MKLSDLTGGNPAYWVSGAAQQPANQWVTSPLDNEIYQRIAATNGSTTDPANDVTNYIARSFKRTLSVPATSYAAAGFGFYGCLRSTLTATIASGRTNVLTVSGRGSLSILGFFSGANSTVRVEIFCDGRSVYDKTDTLPGFNGLALVNVGFNGDLANGGGSTVIIPDPNPITFRRSLQIFLTVTTANLNSNPFIAYRVRGEE